MYRKFKGLLIPLLIMALGFAASCVKTTSTMPDDTNAPTPEPLTSEIIKEQLLPGVTLNITQLSGWVEDSVYDTLLYMDPNEPETIKGCLAESWSHSDDHLTWTFKIKDAVQFSDGTSCDAEAAAKWLNSEEVNKNYCGIASVYAKEGNLLVIELASPCAWFETELCVDTYRIKKSGSSGLPVGTGPYIIDEYVEWDEELMRTYYVLKANVNYHTRERIPRFETLTLCSCVLSDHDALSKMLLEGERDISVFFDASDVDFYAADGHSVETALSKDYTALWLNPTRHEAFTNIEVRKAVNRFIDLDALNEACYGSYGKVQSSIWAEGSVESVPYDGFYYDSEEGHALLADAGYSASDLSFEIIDGWKMIGTPPTVVEQIAAQLNKAGMDVEVSYVEKGLHLVPDNCRVLNVPVGLNYRYNSGLAALGQIGTGPHAAWKSIMLKYEPNALTPPADITTSYPGQLFEYKHSWQEIYAPELYTRMCEIYDRMISTPHWDEMVECSRELTRIVQEDYAAMPLVQEPVFFAVREGAEEQFEALTQTSMFKWMYQ